MMTAAGGDPVNIEDVFHTQVYTGTNANQQVTNGIDLSTEGGLLWFKSRSNSDSHRLIDTERGLTKSLSSHLGAQETNYNASYPWLTSFNTDGFTIGNQNDTNYNGYEYVGWTFRKAPKFFDIVTYTGNGTAGRTISHNLGTTVGSVWVKRRDSSAYWMIYHKGIHSSNPEYYHLALNETFSFNDLGQSQSNPSNMWNQTAPTSTQITLGSDTNVNENNATYVAYVFAHNNNDGGFGPDEDKDVIKCGTYTGDGGAGTTEVNLGFEPQWILVKASSAADNWFVIDNMRGWATHNNQSNDAYLYPNNSNAESTGGFLDITSTGFKTTLYSNVNVNNREYIYIAIRRGPMATPENASDVFAVDAVNTSATPNYVSGFPVDFLIERSVDGSNTRFYDRLRGQNQLYTDNNWAEGTGRGSEEWDHMTGVKFVNSSNYYCWMWKRAPGFFDVVTWEGASGTLNSVKHNLGVKPDLVILKYRGATDSWYVYNSETTGYLNLDTSGATVGSTDYMASTTATDLNVTGLVSNPANKPIAYLFATLNGISKVGTYTGNGGSGTTGNTQNIDCGFSNGAKFVMIKPLNANDSWLIFDTERGITSGGSDPFFPLNETDQQIGGDNINPYSSGFTVVQHGNASTNLTGREYIFYAVAV